MCYATKVDREQLFSEDEIKQAREACEQLEFVEGQDGSYAARVLGKYVGVIRNPAQQHEGPIREGGHEEWTKSGIPFAEMAKNLWLF
eukprot:11814156-Alexandrium_andersonii.AAC.1